MYLACAFVASLFLAQVFSDSNSFTVMTKILVTELGELNEMFTENSDVMATRSM